MNKDCFAMRIDSLYTTLPPTRLKQPFKKLYKRIYDKAVRKFSLCNRNELLKEREQFILE